jgi:segregation and condensation protein B
VVRVVAELPMDADDDLREVEGEASEHLVSILESLLFCAPGPLTVKSIRRVLKDPSTHQIQLALKQLVQRRATSGVMVAQVAGGFRLQTNPINASWVQALLQLRPVRLSRAQLETLAIVAYRQPVTKAEVDHVRGVDCSAVLHLLLERALVQIIGKKDEPGRPMLYGTTVRFLEFFNLVSLRDLPDLGQIEALSSESRAELDVESGEHVAAVLGQGVIDFVASDLERRATVPTAEESE